LFNSAIKGLDCGKAAAIFKPTTHHLLLRSKATSLYCIMAGVKALYVAGFVLVVLLNTALASPFDPYAPWTDKKEEPTESVNQFHYFETVKQDEKSSTNDVAMIEAFINVVNAMAKRKYQIGTAIVSNAKDPCPVGDRGATATGEADGCEHEDCTEAKNAARAALRAEVDPACYKHIQSGRSCEKVNCPKKKG
jgi:hypothetical protein